MTRIAVTGHMNLTPSTDQLVYDMIYADLASRGGAAELIGISCIARGADSIFARATLDVGGRLEVVLPSANYRATKVGPDHASQFDTFLDRAIRIHTVPSEVADRAAYEAANEILLSTSDTLFAVWDGCPAVDKGGTASVVNLARERGMPVHVIWPPGARRT